MIEPNDMSDAQSANDEVELTAEDLRALASPSAFSESRRDPIAAPANSRQCVTGAADQNGRRGIPGMGLLLGTVVAVVATAGGFHAYFTKGSTRQTATATANQATVQPSWAASDQKDSPVRFANPFDATEDFEFPAGTSEAEAREAIAGFLIERAMNRQARLESKPKRNP